MKGLSSYVRALGWMIENFKIEFSNSNKEFAILFSEEKCLVGERQNDTSTRVFETDRLSKNSIS